VFSCGSASSSESENSSIFITDWQLNIGSGFKPSGPVPWDYPAAKGGANAADYNGEGVYSANVVIPHEIDERQLAFFMESVDDADVTYLNGVKIGSTGRFPYTPGGVEGYVSAWRSPRVYPLPQNLIRFNADNLIEVKVYDFSGRGGLAGNSPPQIGNFEFLESKAIKLHNINNIPRIAVIAIMFFFFMKYSAGFAGNTGVSHLKYILRRIVEEFNPVFFIRETNGTEKLLQIFSRELKFSYLCAAITLFCFIVFIFFELTFNENFSSVRLLPVWYHIKILYAGFIALLVLLHRDIFSYQAGEVSASYYAGRIVLGIITHPFIFLCYYIYILFLPENIVCNDFPARGYIMMVVIIICMIVSTLIHVIRISSEPCESGMKLQRKLLLGEKLLRIVFLMGTISSVIIFVVSSSLLFIHTSTLAALFITVYLAFTIDIQKRRDRLYRFFENNLSRSSTRIVSSEEKVKSVITFIEQNYTERITRDEIADATGMSGDHLSRIFRAYTGKIITDYINEIRVKNAAEMLVETDRTIIEISFDSGFNSVRTFNRVFADYMKINPTQYRVMKRRGDPV